MLSWETGVLFGQALEQIKTHEARLTHVEAEVITIKAIVYRGALVLALWGGGLLLNLPADKMGELTATFIKGLSK
jgi:hypothetical protein